MMLADRGTSVETEEPANRLETCSCCEDDPVPG